MLKNGENAKNAKYLRENVAPVFLVLLNAFLKFSIITSISAPTLWLYVGSQMLKNGKNAKNAKYLRENVAPVFLALLNAFLKFSIITSISAPTLWLYVS